MPLLDSPLSVKSGFSLCHCFQCIIFFVVTTDLPSILATFYFIKSLKAEKDPATPSRAYIHIENMLFILGYSFRMCPYLMTSINEEAMETIDKIKQQIAENPILLYMKGSPKLPSCGFSSQAAQALMACGEKFAYVDILQNPDIRAELPVYAQWPTFPQLWIEGELIGGCDIMLEMFQKGELQTLVKEAAARSASQE
ncbi:monothiol glutaredoxin [Vibrio cholerae O1 str. 2010EL-1786]|jgi:monothiol glutaredoxin|nr:monothiol glutaredoxin [Vibrio cholerae O1 str. 2010EL-1786]